MIGLSMVNKSQRAKVKSQKKEVVLILTFDF